MRSVVHGIGHAGPSPRLCQSFRNRYRTHRRPRVMVPRSHTRQGRRAARQAVWPTSKKIRKRWATWPNRKVRARGAPSILIHEWNGLVDRVRQVADALAAEGYVALAADLYSGRTGSNRDENMALVRETLDDPDTIVRNLDAAAAYLRGRSDVNARSGPWAGAMAAGRPELRPGRREPRRHRDLLRTPARRSRATQVHPPRKSTAPSPDSTGVPRPNRWDGSSPALREAGVENDVHIYDDVNHGFWLYVDRDPKNEEPALDAWERLKAYLKRTIGSD